MDTTHKKMNPDFHSAVRQKLQEAVSGPTGTCASFEISDDLTKWIQYADGVINAAYPYHEVPEIRLGELLAKPIIEEIVGFEAGLFVTLSTTGKSDADILHWMEDYFVKILDVPPERLLIDASIQQL